MPSLRCKKGIPWDFSKILVPYWPHISVILIQDHRLFEPGSGSKGIDPVFLQKRLTLSKFYHETSYTIIGC